MPLGNANLLLREQVDYITLDEMESMRRACDLLYESRKKTTAREWMRDRDKLLLSMMWVSGGRISDVLKMDTNKLSFTESNIKFVVKKRKSKKSKNKSIFWHTVVLDPQTLAEIADYINRWEIKGFIFPARLKSRNTLTRQAVNEKLNELTGFAGMRHIHPHEFRHGIAMYLQRQGVPVEAISYHLAHSGTSITLSTYARMNVSQEKMILHALNAKLR